MVKLRLTRVGTKKQPFYRIIAIDSRKKREGSSADCVGIYQPIVGEKDQIRLDNQKALHWLKVGAQMSDTVKSILKRTGVLAEAAKIAASTKVEKVSP